MSYGFQKIRPKLTVKKRQAQSLAAVNYAVRILLVRLLTYARVDALIVRPDRTAPLSLGAHIGA